MKVTFVYTDYGQYNQNNFNRGVAMLSSCLKEKGHKTALVHISKRITEKEFKRLVKKTAPDLVAFSFISNMFSQVKQFSVWVSEMNIRAIHGGMHPTVAPEECLAAEGINVVARGEGEGIITDFCAALGSSDDIKNIPGLWVKDRGRIYRNPQRDLIENLDKLPYPDYELFNYENLEEGAVHKILVTQASRGCNYDCTYCCNHAVRSLYKNSGRYLRYYSVDRLLDEIEAGLKRYPFLKEVRFYDDTITQDKRWFGEFARKYKKRINLPYSGNERVENIDTDSVALLKESGCISLDLGIESGSQFIRQRYMNRWMSSESIVAAFRRLKESGINANSFNILGMVGETPQTVLETIKLNALAGPSVTFNAYFYPFKGTRAYEMVNERGYKIDADVKDFFSRPVVLLDTIKKSELEFFYKYFYLLMRIYKALIKKGRRSRVNSLDRILTSRRFPYSLLNVLHFGKDDILVFLRRHPRIYVFARKIYRSVKGR
jgi:anaerobic magnesium-protoporphyrin IX monomethyl ester cyclase